MRAEHGGPTCAEVVTAVMPRRLISVTSWVRPEVTVGYASMIWAGVSPAVTQ